MRPETALAAEVFRLRVPRRTLQGRIGDRAGRGIGSSIEFEDWRDYQPGDDLRHVDWRGYARTDVLKVRLYREEVAPVLDVVLDVSRSMAVTPRKARAALDLAAAAAFWGRRDGGVVRTLTAGGGVSLDGTEPTFDGADTDLLPRVPLRPRGLRFVVSDFLWEGDPGAAVRAVGTRASHVFVVQLLDPDEVDPPAGGACTLVDVETGARTDLVLDAGARAAYRARLERHTAAVREATRRAGGTFARVVAAEPDTMLRRDLLAADVIEPA